ncbi:dihydrodipicolinate synthase family protein [Polycladidibacter hongkongensis]|uniref:dihydrodipicolinate synthase family protein n=1 Tax=Polycladidibacter hongkongensis TaxID=1647556 RepID=UPI00082F8CC0|nr:dihydrodipicolinate synthase family protein [Pseudovibrio hongkongensis]
MTKILSGLHVALLTGFTDAGEYCAKRQENILGYVLRQNVTGLFVGGSSAEGALMSFAELKQQQVQCRDSAKATGKQLIAHVGQPSLKESIALAENAAALGYDGLSALPPHSYPFNQQEIFEYYRALSQATDLPLIVYEAPFRTGRPTPIDEMVKVLDLPNVTGLKFTSSDLFGLSCLQKARPDVAYFYGFDELLSSAYALGVDGGIGTTYNVLGNLYMAIHEAAQANDLMRMRELQMISQDYVRAIIQTGVMPGTKLTLEILGVDCGPSRAPFTLRGDNPRKIIEDAVNAPGFRDWIAK